MADQAVQERLRAERHRRRRHLVWFALGAFLFWAFEFMLQQFLVLPGDLPGTPSVRSFAFAGTTLIGVALFSSALFRWVPRWAQYWRYRRYLGVSGFILIFFHVWGAMYLYFNFDFAAIYFSLNPVENPLVFGSIAFFILFLMAITSTDWAMQKLTPKIWKTLHRFVYVAYVAAIFHFLRIASVDILMTLPGYLLLVVTAAALSGQLYWFFKTIAKKQFCSFGAFVGYAIILSTLVFAYLMWGR